MSDNIPHYTEGHTVKSYDEEMEQLRTLLLEMGRLVIGQVSQSVKAVCDRDVQVVKQVVRREREVNQYDTDGERLLFGLLAKRQPMAADLRAVLSFSRAITDLERAGDEAKKIAKIAKRHIDDEAAIAPDYVQLVQSMGQLATESLEDAIASMADADEQRAVSVAKADARLDAEYRTARKIIQESLVSEPDLIDWAADLVIVIKALERIGDHAKNIAKYVVFIVEGRDVRHVKTKVLGEST